MKPSIPIEKSEAKVNSRRRALGTIAGASLLGSTRTFGNESEPSPAGAAKPVTLRLASSWPANMPVLGESMREFAKLVAQLSDNTLHIDVVSSDQHGQPLSTFNLVRSGEYDIANTPSYYHTKEEPDALYLTTMPFGMTATELAAFYQHGGGLALIEELYNRHGLSVTLGGNTGMQMGGWFRKPIHSVADLRGLKMRIPGAGGKVLEKLGVETVTLPAEDLYPALVSGDIDAAEFVGPSIDLALGLHRSAPYYYTGWHEPGTELFYLFNSEAMAKLPPASVAILRTAAELAGSRTTSGFNHANARAWGRIRLEYPNIRVTSFPPEVIDQLRTTNEALVREEMARSEYCERTLGAMFDYIKTVRRWTEIGDWSYLANTTR